MIRPLRNTLLDLARALNRHTHRFDGLKARLHLTELANSALVRPIDAEAAASILAKLDTTGVLQRATDDSTFTIIMVEKMGDIVACEPIARFLKNHYPRCKASDDPKRNWDSDKWNALTDRLREDGHRIVEIGINKTIQTLDFDFTGRRSLTDIGDIIAHAALFIGVDSGFAHFANALETPSVILLGKFGNFNRYTPYSGSFAKSPRFQYVRADGGEFTRTIPVDRVLQRIQAALTIL